MKVIIAGATGFIGGEVLRQLLLNPAITSVLSLSRRDLPEAVAKSPKLKNVIAEDMSSYSETLIQEMAGADACIW